MLAGAGTWRRYIQSCLEADGTLDVCLQKSRMLSFQFFFFSPLSLLCFEGVHLILISSQGTGGLLKALCTYLYNVQMELRGVIIMKSLIVLIYYQ